MANREDGNSSARPWQSYHTVYTNAKAGMDGVDKEKVQRVVYEMSKGSKYFENEERKDAFIRQKIDNMRVRCGKLSAADISHYQTVADKRVLELEAMRDLSKIWVHVDMDAFYAAAETLSNPSLKEKPMAVGSMSMISTANYEARKFGVRAAMPGFIARKLCPELIFVPPDFTKYTYYSDLTRKVFQNCDPNFIATSLDEAYLNVTNVCKERGITSEEVAKEIRSSVYEETGLTCSAGVAPNRLLAKVCSDINKPNGQFVLPNDRIAVITFISSLPIRKIGGIGKVTEHILRGALGISTCEDMLQNGSLICALFSHSTADFFLSVGLGLGGTDTPEVKSRKSISNERTFSVTGDELLLIHKLEEIAESLSADMQKEGLCGRTLTLKLKTASFEVRTRAVTLQKYISTSEDILKHASKLLKAELPASLRLIGVRMSHFNEDSNAAPPDPTQKTLTNFFISGDAPSKDMGDQTSLSLDNSDNYFSKHEETDLSIGSHQKCHYNPLDDKHSSELDENNCIFSNNAGQMEKLCPTRNTTANKIESDNMQDGIPQLSGTNNFLSMQFEESCQEKAKNRAIVPKGETISSSNQEELFFWVNGYKCSICGVEMPENFVEERQDHYDFHLAEKFQKEEESVNNFGTSTMRQRHVQNQKNHTASQSKRKKLKSSPKEGKHIPIDLFFVKSGQNF